MLIILTCSQWLNYKGRRSAAAIWQLTTDHSLDLGVDFTEGGEPREKPWKHVYEGILKAPSTAAIWQLTTDHSLDLGVDFTEGGKPENPEKNPSSTGANYNNSTHTWVRSALRINMRLTLYTLYIGGHLSSYNHPTGLN